MKRILIAGIGNIFLGDDAFGCEVLDQLAHRPLPKDVRAVDFGIRCYDLAYAMSEGYDAVILVDATSRGEAPGTLFLIEPELASLDHLAPGAVDAHSLDPVRVLQLADSLGARPKRLYLVGCEPVTLETEESEQGQMGLSTAVQAAVPKAIEMIESLLNDLETEKEKQRAGLVPA